MRPTLSRCFAISSVVLLVALMAQGATRPRYGGTLRVETRAALPSIDPGLPMIGADRAVRNSILTLVGDTLTGLDVNARPLPRLATRWQSSAGNKRWQFWIRAGVFLHNGASLTPAHVAEVLTNANRTWKVHPNSDSVIVESELPVIDLAAELSRPEYAIVVRVPEGLVGTGPYRIEQFEPGRRLVLKANEDDWEGRPYVDVLDIALNRTLRDQATDLQLGRADVIEIGAEQARRVSQESRRVVMTAPNELLAIVFPQGYAAAEDPRLREALSLAIDRSAIQSFLLQRQGDRAGGLLPQWISGYAILFSTNVDVARARQLRAQVPSGQVGIVLTYDPGDSLARSIAERIAVNARDAGIGVQVSPLNAQTAQAPRIVRIPIGSSNARAALASVVSAVEPDQVSRVLAAGTSEELYDVERGLLDDFRVVPLVHVPQPVVIAPRVRNWSGQGGRVWALADVWLEGGGQ